MILCPNGHPNPNGATYCGVCKVYIDAAAQPEPEPPPPPPPPPPEPEPEPPPRPEPEPEPPPPPPPPRAAPPSISLSQTSLRGTAGGEVSTVLRLQNVGELADEYTINVYGPAAPFAAVEPWSMALPPRTDSSSRVTFRPSAAASGLPFEIRVTSALLPNQPASVQGSLDVDAPAPPPPPPSRPPSPPPSPPERRRGGAVTASGVGLSLFLIAIGLILREALSGSAKSSVAETFNPDTAGLILIVVGVAGLLLAITVAFATRDR